MGIIDKMNGSQNSTDKPADTPKDTPADSVETKGNTLEEALTTSQNDRVDKSEKGKTDSDDSKEKVIVSLKKELKSQNRQITEMKTLVSDLVSAIEGEKNAKLSNEKIKAFAEKRGVAPEDIKELAELLRDEVAPQSSKKDVQKGKNKVDEPEDEDEDEEDDDELDTKAFQNKKRLEKAVDKLISDFLEDMPEYSDIVDEDTVKEMILANPTKYAKLNMNQIVEKIYGKAVKGKRGVEKFTPNTRGDKKKPTGKVSDEEFKEIQKDPEARKEWRKGLVERASKILF